MCRDVRAVLVFFLFEIELTLSAVKLVKRNYTIILLNCAISFYSFLVNKKKDRSELLLQYRSFKSFKSDELINFFNEGSSTVHLIRERSLSLYHCIIELLKFITFGLLKKYREMGDREI